MPGKNKGWVIKVPLGNDELYVMDEYSVKLYETKEQAEDAAKICKRYRVVYYEFGRD
jgi:hypothetical protein